MGFNAAVPQTFGVITRHHQLHGGKKGSDKCLFLVVQILVNPFRHGHCRPCQLNHTKGNLIYTENNIRTFLVLPFYAHLFGNGEIVFKRMPPLMPGMPLTELVLYAGSGEGILLVDDEVI